MGMFTQGQLFHNAPKHIKTYMEEYWPITVISLNHSIWITLSQNFITVNDNLKLQIRLDQIIRASGGITAAPKLPAEFGITEKALDTSLLSKCFKITLLLFNWESKKLSCAILVFHQDFFQDRSRNMFGLHKSIDQTYHTDLNFN